MLCSNDYINRNNKTGSITVNQGHIDVAAVMIAAQTLCVGVA